MPNIYENTIEAVQHLPTEWDNPVLTGAAVVTIAGAGLVAKYYHNHTPEKGAVDARGISQALEDSKIGADKDSNKRRFSPITQAAFGAGFLAIHLIGQPGYEATFADAGAEVMIVADASNSMTLTFDLGIPEISRFDGVVSGIQKSEFAGSMGFIKMGETVSLITSPTKDWATQIPNLKEVIIDPNGGKLIAAMTQAAEQITLDPETKQRAGTVVLISDGTVSNRTADLAKKAEQLKAEGITVKVISPGTAAGTYIDRESNSEAKSAVKPDNLAMFDKTIGNPTSVAETIEVINDEIKSSGTRREREQWPIPIVAATALGAYALTRFVTRTLTRKY